MNAVQTGDLVRILVFSKSSGQSFHAHRFISPRRTDACSLTPLESLSLKILKACSKLSSIIGLDAISSNQMMRTKLRTYAPKHSFSLCKSESIILLLTREVSSDRRAIKVQKNKTNSSQEVSIGIRFHTQEYVELTFVTQELQTCP